MQELSFDSALSHAACQRGAAGRHDDPSISDGDLIFFKLSSIASMCLDIMLYLGLIAFYFNDVFFVTTLKLDPLNRVHTNFIRMTAVGIVFFRNLLFECRSYLGRDFIRRYITLAQHEQALGRRHANIGHFIIQRPH